MKGSLKDLKKEPTRIENVLGNVLKKIGLERRYKESQINQEWEKWVGKSIATHAKPYRVINKNLVVYVDHSVWLTELNRYYKVWILKKIQTALGKNLIKEIIFKIGELPQNNR